MPRAASWRRSPPLRRKSRRNQVLPSSTYAGRGATERESRGGCRRRTSRSCPRPAPAR
jgi:hypothetical protein